jgi:hypothetical protein
MGWCHEFGAQVREGCDHAMVAGAASCACPECGFECTGKFAGCSVVWAAGPRAVAPRRRDDRPAPRRAGRGAAADDAAAATEAEVPAGTGAGSRWGRSPDGDAAGSRAARRDSPRLSAVARRTAADRLRLDRDDRDDRSTAEPAVAADEPVVTVTPPVLETVAVAPASESDIGPGDVPYGPTNGGWTQPAGDARLEVLDWLRIAFDGVRVDIRSLRDTVGSGRAEVAAMKEAGRAAERLVELVDSLPERVGEAVVEALRNEHDERLASITPIGMAAFPPPAALAPAAPSAPSERSFSQTVVSGAAVGEHLREALSEMQSAAAELRNEMTRLAAFREALADDLPSIADAVDRASERADGRLQDLTRRVESMSGRPGWREAIESLRAEIPAAAPGEGYGRERSNPS